MATAALGWGRPLGGGGSGGWDWWALLGVIVLFLLIESGWRRPPLVVAIVLAAIGGLLVGDLTQAWGVIPVWGGLLLIALSRNLLRRDRPPQV